MAKQKLQNGNWKSKIGDTLHGIGASFKALTKKQRGVLAGLGALALLLLAGGITGGILAKYISQNRQEAEMISAGFHISSDYLKETGNEISIAPGNEILISLYNWEVENAAQVAEMNITYQVTVAGGSLSSITLDDTDTTVTATDSYYTLALSGNTTHKTAHVLHVTPEAGATEDVSVTVAATAPYVKTLSAVFKRSEAAPAYTLTQHTPDDVWKLTINTNGYTGNIKIVLGTGVAPDNTNNVMESWTTASTNTLAVQDNETYELLFFGQGITAVETDTAITAPAATGITVGSN